MVRGLYKTPFNGARIIKNTILWHAISRYFVSTDLASLKRVGRPGVGRGVPERADAAPGAAADAGFPGLRPRRQRLARPQGSQGPAAVTCGRVLEFSTSGSVDELGAHH